MDVRQLAALVAIADHGTFSAAARALFTVQSNVSSHIARLERELGTTLVDRAQGGLTEDGRASRRPGPAHPARDGRHRRRRGPGRRRRHRRRAHRHPRHDGPLAAPSPAYRPSRPSHPGVRAIISEGSTSALIPGLLIGTLQRRHHPPPGRRPGADHRAAVRRGPPARHPPRAPAGRPRRAVAGRTGDAPPAAPAARVGAAPRARPGGPLGRGRSCRRRPRSTACACSPRWPSTVTARRSCPATAVPPVTVRAGLVRVPELPPRVVALAHQRRPAPGPPARALFDVLREVLAERGRRPARRAPRHRRLPAQPAGVVTPTRQSGAEPESSRP